MCPRPSRAVRRVCPRSVESITTDWLDGDEEIGVVLETLFDEGTRRAAWWSGMIVEYRAGGEGSYVVEYDADRERQAYTPSELYAHIFEGTMRFVNTTPCGGGRQA